MSFLKGETDAPDGADNSGMTRRRFVQGIAAAGMTVFVGGKFGLPTRKPFLTHHLFCLVITSIWRLSLITWISLGGE